MPVLLRRAARSLLVGALALVGGATACSAVTVPVEDPAATTYAPALGVNLARMTRTPSGLYYEDVAVGSGAVADSGRVVSTFYDGWLTNGRLFDSNRDSGRPLSFTLGVGQVIRGWDEGLRGMRVGGRRRLVIPPSLGYGNRTSSRIPAGSVLVFLIDLQGVTGGS